MDQIERQKNLLSVLYKRKQTPELQARIQRVKEQLGMVDKPKEIVPIPKIEKKKKKKIMKEVEVEVEVDDDDEDEE